MEFRVLGPVEVAAGEHATRLGRGHRRTILACLLAARGATVTTERLIEGVWDAAPPASARKSLQSHLSRLRDELGGHGGGAPPAVVSEPDGYRVDLAHHDLDAEAFEQLAMQARRVLHEDPQRAAALLGEALARWRGSSYGDLASKPTIRPEAIRLDQLRAAAEADHVDARLVLGAHDEVVGELERRVVEEPLGERHHAQLMLALYRGGRQGDALTTFQKVRERLADELGADPSPQLRRLHERILRQDEGLGVPNDAPAGRHEAPTRTPATDAEPPERRPTPSAGRPAAPPVELVGRSEEVADVAVKVAPGSLVTLTGPGGVGKTTLAEWVATEVAERFPDGVVVATLAAVGESSSVGDALITGLGIQPTGERSTTETLIAALGQRRLLLLLDNCEHLLDAVAPLVEAILGRCPRVGVLATSRERLHLAGEQLWAVDPLPVPPVGASAAEVAGTPAGALFSARARAAEPAFRLTELNAAAVTELCRRLDGMPLALELAAARVRALSPEDLAARLDQRFTLLSGGPRHEAGRHRTLQAVVAWSYELLEPREKQLFDRLSVFAGTFDLEAAEQVCAGEPIGPGEVAGLLGELVDKSMLVVDRGDRVVRYRFLDTLREYGARRLAATDDPRWWRHAHAAHHLLLVERLGPEVRGPDEADAVADVDAAFNDLRTAHARLLADDDVEGALRLPAALGDYAFYRLRDEVTTWACRALALDRADQFPSYAAALTTAASGATSRDECERARRDGEEALRRSGPTSMTRVWALAALGTAALYEGRLDDLLHDADELIELAQRLELPFHRAFAGVLRVIGHAYRGEPDAAVDSLPGLEEAATASACPTMLAFARYCRGEAYLDVDPERAAGSLEEAIRLARQVDNALIEGVSRVSLASLRGRSSRPREALALFRDTIAHWRRLGDHTHQLTTLRNLVVLLADLGEEEPAAVLHGAVTAGLTPSFGAEARRLQDAWRRIESRMGGARAATAAARGRDLGPTDMGEFALDHLDEMLER